MVIIFNGFFWGLIITNLRELLFTQILKYRMPINQIHLRFLLILFCSPVYNVYLAIHKMFNYHYVYFNFLNEFYQLPSTLCLSNQAKPTHGGASASLHTYYTILLQVTLDSTFSLGPASNVAHGPFLQKPTGV